MPTTKTEIAGGAIAGQVVQISGQPVRVSGEVVIISGQFVSISGQPVQISGQTINALISGQFVLISGQSVLVSGQPIAISGQVVIISGQAVRISGQMLDRTWRLSGLTDSVAISGQVVIISGQFVNISGQTVAISGQSIGISGQTIVAQFASGVTLPTSISGQPVRVSGQMLDRTWRLSGLTDSVAISGQVVIISGQVVIISGQFVSVSGQPVSMSGQPVAISGQTVVAQFASGVSLPVSISGQPVQVSGQTIVAQFASGVSLPVSISGQPVGISGEAVVISGQFVNISGQLMGRTWVLSGLTDSVAISGQTIVAQFASGVAIPTSISGQPVQVSGQTVITQFASGVTFPVNISGQTIITQFASGVSIPTSISGQPVGISGQAVVVSGQGIQIIGPNITPSPISSYYSVVGSSFTNAVITSGGALMVADGFEVDSNNSTTTILGAGGTFTGVFRDLTGYSQVSIFISSDVDSAPIGLQVEFSDSSTGIFGSVKYYTIRDRQTIHVPVNAKFYKITYTNGGTPQTVFSLQSILNPIPSIASVRELGIPISFSDEAMTTQSIIAGENVSGLGVYSTALVTRDGKLHTLSFISGQSVVISGQSVAVSGQAIVISGQGIQIIGQNIVALPADTRFNVVGSSFAEVVTTSGGALMVANGLEPDANNITTTALGIGATWNGISRDLTGYSQITVNVVTDVPGTLNITWSTGFATGLTETKTYSILGLYAETIHIPVNAKFYRVGYTNGAVAQILLRIQSLLSPIPSVGTIRNIDRPIESQEDSMITHSVIAGPIAVGGSSFIDNVVLPDGQSLVQINQSGQVFGVDGYNKALIQEDVIHRKIHQGTYFYADVSQSASLSNPAAYAITQMSGVNPHLSWHLRGLTPGSLVNVLEVTSARQTTGTVSSNIFLNRTITAFTSTRLYSSYVLGSNVGANSILFETMASGSDAYGFGNLYTYPLIPGEWVLKGGFTYVFQILSAVSPSLTTLYTNWYESGLA